MRPHLVRFALVVTLALAAASCGGKSSSYTTNPPPAGELSGSLPTTGAQYAHTFTHTGAFSYFCTIHSGCGSLAGTVTVVSAATPTMNRVLAISITGGSAGGPYSGPTCSALSNQADSVVVGDQVTWTNSSPLPHTVTSP